MRKTALTLVCLISSMLVLMLPAFINGYPIVYSDTSTYLASGFELEAPFDRPITYGIFVRLFSFNGVSLWTVVAAQSLLLAFLLFRLLKKLLVGYKCYAVVNFVIVLLLSLFSSVSWVSSHIMPDIFTPIMLLAAVILALFSNNKKEKLFLYAVFFVSCSMHMSHVSFSVVFFACILLLGLIKSLNLSKLISPKPIVILLLLSIASIVTMGSALSKSKHAFFMGAMVEHGIAKKYLDENCDTKAYQLCQYKDSLPKKAWQFLWEKSSPFYKMGAWKGTKEEFLEITKNTLTSPKFILLHIKESLKATLSQLIKFEVGKAFSASPKGTLLYERVEKYIPHELNQYESSGQNNERLHPHINFFNAVQTIVVLVSLLAALVFLFVFRSKTKVFFLLILGGILINAWVSGTFANAIDRLGTKMIWLLPMIVLVGLAMKLIYIPKRNGKAF